MLKYVTPFWGNIPPCSEIVDISCKKGSQKQLSKKTGDIYSVYIIYRYISTRDGASRDHGDGRPPLLNNNVEVEEEELIWMH